MIDRVGAGRSPPSASSGTHPRPSPQRLTLTGTRRGRRRGMAHFADALEDELYGSSLSLSEERNGVGIGVGAGIHTDGVDITWMEKECAPLTEALWFFGRRAYNILASLAVPVWGGLGQPVGQPRGICNSHTCTPSQEGPQANRTLWR